MNPKYVTIDATQFNDMNTQSRMVNIADGALKSVLILPT
jgi:hypothetical protein